MLNRFKAKKGKCEYGYIAYQKKFTLLRTFVYFLISFLLYLTGRLSTGTSGNLLTVVAVLGCLPSSKSLVNAIMFLRATGCSEALQDEIVTRWEGESCYDMLLTSYEENFPLSHLVIVGNQLCAVSESEKCNPQKAQEHLETWFKKNGFSGMSYKVFLDQKKYLERLESLKKLEKSGKEESQYQLVKELSL